MPSGSLKRHRAMRKVIQSSGEWKITSQTLSALLLIMLFFLTLSSNLLNTGSYFPPSFFLVFHNGRSGKSELTCPVPLQRRLLLSFYRTLRHVIWHSFTISLIVVIGASSLTYLMVSAIAEATHMSANGQCIMLNVLLPFVKTDWTKLLRIDERRSLSARRHKTSDHYIDWGAGRAGDMERTRSIRF